MTSGTAKLSGECIGFNAGQLEELVKDFGNVFSGGSTGTTDVVTREPVKEEIKALEEAGMITHLDNPH